MPEIRGDALQGYACDPRCKCGQHPDHLDLDKAFLRKELTLQEYADRVGCHKTSVERHVKGHLPDALLAAKDIATVADGDSLLSELKKVRERTFSLLDKAENAADTRAYGPPSGYLREIRSQLQLLAELEGRIASQPTVNITVSAEWVELRTVIITALDPFPQAKEAMINAICGR